MTTFTDTAVRDMLVRVFVLTFYRHYAGLFFFVFVVFFGIVAPSMQIDYHYKLIMGMLATPGLMAVVMLGWLGYGLMCVHWVRSRLRHPAYRFLFVLPSGIGMDLLMRMLLRVQLLLYSPVWIYALATAGVAVSKGMFFAAGIVVIYMIAICVTSVRIYRRWLLSTAKSLNPGL